MPKFRVPAELHPGVSRSGVGFFTPGSVLTLPDSASVCDAEGKLAEPINLHLIPLDEEGKKLLEWSRELTIQRRAANAAAAKARRESNPGSAYVPNVKPVETAPPPEASDTDGDLTLSQAAKGFFVGKGDKHQGKKIRESDK